VGFFIPPAPEGQKAPMFNDLYVDTDGLIYVTDRIKGGLYVLEYTGPKVQ
jgi:sugar lactone lactonase YvrE